MQTVDKQQGKSRAALWAAATVAAILLAAGTARADAERVGSHILKPIVVPGAVAERDAEAAAPLPADLAEVPVVDEQGVVVETTAKRPALEEAPQR